MIYKKKTGYPNIELHYGDYHNFLLDIKGKYQNIVVVTDPPFNIGYHYNEYDDKMDDTEYYKMLASLLDDFPSVIIHYPEALHKLSVVSGVVPERCISWVYNSNTPRQHRDCCFYKIAPNFKNTLQEYKNLNDKRIQERIERGILGGKMYDWFFVNQIKNVSEEKTGHPCQMPVEVMKNLISTLPEESIIFDPFMGSGTTAIACIELGYDFVGCELNEDYYNISKNRVEHIVTKHRFF